MLTSSNDKSLQPHKQNGYSISSASIINLSSSSCWDDCLPVPKLNLRACSISVFSLAVLCFCNSYNGDFVFDDSEAIVGNKDVRPESSIADLFSHDFWGGTLASKTSHKSYRPFTILTFRLNYAIAGGLHPTAFHVVNIILHGVVSVLIIPLSSVVFGGYATDDQGRWHFQAHKASLLSGVLFAVHPIHTESVAAVVGRADLLCALLFISSFLLYCKACQGFSLPCLCISMLLCAVSVLCKEQGITVIGICCVYDLIVVCRIHPLRVLMLKADPKLSASCSVNNNQSPVRVPKNSKQGPDEDTNNECGIDECRPSSYETVIGTVDECEVPVVEQQQQESAWLKPLIYRQGILTVTAASILLTRWRVMGSAPPTFQVVDNPHSFVNGTLLRVMNYNYLYSLNAWILLNPWWLCFDWAMGCIPVISSFADPRILCSILFWCIMGLLIYCCLSGEILQEQRAAVMSLAFVVVPFLPASNLFFRVGFVIAERVLYLSSIGVCILIVLGVRRLCLISPVCSQVVKAGLLVLISVFIARSMQRSAEWCKEKDLFYAGVKVCPLNAKVHYNIGKISTDMGQNEEAIQRYQHAIMLHPTYDQAMNNLGNLLKDLGRREEAEELLLRAVAIRAEFAAAWMNLGIVQASLSKPDLAERSYFTALKHRRKYPDCLYNLGNLYLDLGRHDDALKAWHNATVLKPDHSNSWNNMILLLDNTGQFTQAVAMCNLALKNLGESSMVYYNLANMYGKAGKYEESEENFLKVQKLDPNNSQLYGNLGVLYHRWGRFMQAESAYLRALELEPTSKVHRDNLDMLRHNKKKNT